MASNCVGLAATVSACLLAVLIPIDASAQEETRYARPYTAFDAGADARARSEAQRREALERQIGVIQYNRWWNGLPMTLRSRYLYPQDRASFYAYDVKRRRHRALGVFEHWPYLPGDIWGYTYDLSVPQSVGQRQVQTGPNRWESHPVYPTPLRLPPERRGPRAY